MKTMRQAAFHCIKIHCLVKRMIPGCKIAFLFTFMFFFRWYLYFIFSGFSRICQISGFLGLIPHGSLIYKCFSTVEPSFLNTGDSTTKYSEKLTIKVSKKTLFLCRLYFKRDLLRAIKLLGKIGTNFKAQSLLKRLFLAN